MDLIAKRVVAKGFFQSYPEFEPKIPAAVRDVIRARLDRLSMQLGRIERDQQVIAEMLALFVRFQLTVTAPIAEADRAARALGQARYDSFLEQVSRRLAGSAGTIEDVLAHHQPAQSAP